MRTNKEFNLVSDGIFKALFADENNKDILLDFLTSTLNIPVKRIHKVKFRNTELLPSMFKTKVGRLDLLIEVDNVLINVEMQVRSTDDYVDRTLFYWSKIYSGNLFSGQKYKQLRKTISLNILDYVMFKEKTDYHSVYLLKEEKDNTVLTNKLEIHYIELPKVPPINDMKVANNGELWLKLLNAKTKGDLDMLRTYNNPKINKAISTLYSLTIEKIKDYFELISMVRHDNASYEATVEREKRDMLQQGREEGRKQGIEQGIEQGREQACEKSKVAMREYLISQGKTENEIQEALKIFDNIK